MKGDFAAHLEGAVASVNKLKGYFHEDVRQGVQVPPSPVPSIIIMPFCCCR